MWETWQDEREQRQPSLSLWAVVSRRGSSRGDEALPRGALVRSFWAFDTNGTKFVKASSKSNRFRTSNSEPCLGPGRIPLVAWDRRSPSRAEELVVAARNRGEHQGARCPGAAGEMRARSALGALGGLGPSHAEDGGARTVKEDASAWHPDRQSPAGWGRGEASKEHRNYCCARPPGGKSHSGGTRPFTKSRGYPWGTFKGPSTRN